VCEIGGAIILEGGLKRKRLVPADLPYNKIKSHETESVMVEHRRLVYYVPEKFLVIQDRLDSDKERDYTQWFNFFPNLETTIDGREVIVSDPEEVLAVMRVDIEEPVITKHRGEEEPRLQGWVSSNGHTLEKSDSIGIRTRGKKAVISTMIDVDFGSTKKFSTNISSEGKYIRITVLREDGKYDLKIRNKGEKITIEHDENGNSESIEISIID
jgi:hypothetical protein